jgi:hypothetical protein
MKMLMTGLALVLMAGTASAEYIYDWRSGNSYNVYDFGGTTTIYGRNNRTGSSWTNRIEPDGDMSGRDSNGNLWNYDSSTGNYRNTDGTFCTGKGVFRTCY